MRRALLFLAVLIVVAAGVPGAARAGDPPIERTPEFRKRVNEAIDKGVAFLRTTQGKDGNFTEYPCYDGALPALVYLALRSSHVPASDPAAVAGFDAMRRTYAARYRADGIGSAYLRTYTAGLYCMALAEHGEPQAARDGSGARAVVLSAEDDAWMRELVLVLEHTQDAKGRWSYGGDGGKPDPKDFDNSNTQYALLGLKAASRAGVRANTSTWMKSLQHFLDFQEDHGRSLPKAGKDRVWVDGVVVTRANGWGYAKGATGSDPSMTASGISAVVLCRSELLGTPEYKPGLDARAERSVREGIAWLGLALGPLEVFGQCLAPEYGMATYKYYQAYAIERAGVLSGIERMVGHDWYAEGAEALLSRQSPDGSWPDDTAPVKGVKPPTVRPAYDRVIVTCFALLFLAKSTAPVGRGSLTASLDDTDINFAAAAALADRDFEDFIDLVLSRWGRAADPAVKDRLFAKTTAVGPRIVAPLVLRLASERDDVRAAAIALLKRATGRDDGYDPAAADEARAAAVARWQAWWLANERTLHFDQASGKLVP